MMNPHGGSGGSNKAATPAWLQDDVEINVPLHEGPPSHVPGIQSKAPSSSSPSPETQYGLLGLSENNQKNKGLIHYGLKAFTVAMCVLMSATAVIGLESIDGVDQSGKVFVATYMFFFSALIFLFEIVEFIKVEWIDHVYRRNFGFLYSVPGKSLFIIFIAFLSFGLGDPQTLTISTGFVWAAFGALQLGIYLKYPELFE